MEQNTDVAGRRENGTEHSDGEETAAGTVHAPAWTRVVPMHALAWTIDSLAWTRVDTIYALVWTRVSTIHALADGVGTIHALVTAGYPERG